MRAMVWAFLLMSVLLGQTEASLPAEVDGQPVPSLAPLIEKVTPAVVNIHSRTRVQVRTSPFMDDPFFRRFFDFPSVPRERIQQSLGSGVVVDAQAGLILTNTHVIDGADDIAVTLQDGREFAGTLIGSDRDTDLAVIRIEASGLTELALVAEDGLRVGDFVVAIGNPFGLGQTVTSGIVSALGRSGLRGLEYQNFIQTDASINPGNSGGALIDLRGRLVGINTAIFTPSGGNVGIGFAVPASTAHIVKRQIERYGEVRRGSLGIQVQDLSNELRDALNLGDQPGVIVNAVQPGGSLATSGVQRGDVLTHIDERTVNTAQGLRNIEGLLPVGEAVTLHLLRDGQRLSVRVQIEEDLDQRISGRRLDARLDGLVLSRVPPRSNARGVVVEEARRQAPAAAVGLRAGDLIVAINRQPVTDLASFRAQFPVADNSPMELEFRRAGYAYRLVLEAAQPGG